jgi:serine/threonine protein kinase
MTENNENNTRSFVPLSKGTMIFHYRILEKIGAGGMGDVWLAHDEKLNRKVALKFLSTEIYEGIESQEMLLSEARAAAALHHPNVVTIYEAGIFEKRPFIAMAYIEGPTLNELEEKRQIPVEMTVRFGIQISNGLADAHEHGITHRDLKPRNIIVDKSNDLHILDFGLAVKHSVFNDNDPDKTVTKLASLNLAAGTLNYMAPEQLTGGKIGPLVDIYALGIILYELIYDEHPFKGNSSTELIRNTLRDTPPRFSDKRDDVPYDLIRIVGRCLQKDPEYRFQTAKDVRNELKDLQEMMIKGHDSSVSYPAVSDQRSFLREERFVLTTDSVRQLEFQSPKMIGDHIAYLDNGIISDTLVIYLHAWGLDHRQCEDFIKALPCRGIAPALYGFGQQAKHRFPLTLNDHSILFRNLFSELRERINPKQVILTGHSSGADHAMHISISDIHRGLDITGLLLFGCNTNLESCFISAKFAELNHSNADELLGEMKRIGNNAKSLGEWLKFHEYMVTVFSKFGTNADPLRVFGSDLVKPFKENDWRQFTYWYQAATKKIPHVRFVIDADDFEAMDKILEYHLKENVLGDEFKEDTIVRENVPHVELAHPEILLKNTLDFIGRIEVG